MKPRGAITLVFDDGYQSVLDDVVPLLDRYAVPGVFAVPLDATALAASEARRIASWQTWRAALHPRHELAAHSLTHRDLTVLPPADLERELREPAAALHATTLVYPGGAHTDAVVALAQRYYRAARTVRPGLNRLPPSDPWRLKTYNFTRHNFSPWRANLLALWACLTGRWLIETYHIVDTDETEKIHAVRLDHFAAHLAFIKKLPIRIATIREVMENGSYAQ